MAPTIGACSLDEGFPGGWEGKGQIVLVLKNQAEQFRFEAVNNRKLSVDF